jgi:hypothetical protein
MTFLSLAIETFKAIRCDKDLYGFIKIFAARQALIPRKYCPSCRAIHLASDPCSYTGAPLAPVFVIETSADGLAGCKDLAALETERSPCSTLAISSWSPSSRTWRASRTVRSLTFIMLAAFGLRRQSGNLPVWRCPCWALQSLPRSWRAGLCQDGGALD